jgi:hypothetical protein
MPRNHEQLVEGSRRLAATCAIGFDTDTFRGKLALGTGRNTSLIRTHVLKVSPELTPGIEDSVRVACDNLGFPRELLDVYISPQRETNAFSSSDHGRALVIVNAAMVEILGKEELAFVVGHEIGHFLLPEINAPRGDSLEGALYSRRSELTMDRIGLLACRDADKACHAKIKMLSGLTERHLRMDIAALIADWNSHAKEGAHEALLGASHPPPGLRAKALLKFQGSDYYRNICGLEGGTPLAEVNKATLDELHRFVDGAAELSIKDQLNRLSGWAAGFAASHGIKVRLASFRTPHCDAPEDYVRQCIGVIIQDTPEPERMDKALRKFHEYLTSATATAPARTSAYLSHLAKEEPALGELISRIRVIPK